jgi:8-oxo-dGTP pyrophosphatase MutT (NUDIX family)
MPHIHEKIDFTVKFSLSIKTKLLLRLHDKYKIWLSIGGHIELDEDPNEAAYREVKEEVGLDIELIPEKPIIQLGDDNEKELLPPRFMKRHFISTSSDHEHIVLTYFARTNSDNVTPEKPTDVWKWVTREELKVMDLRPDIRHYAEKALEELAHK